MKTKTREGLALGLFMLFFLDLAWRLAHWGELYERVNLDWRIPVFALAVRLAVLSVLFRQFLRWRAARKSSTIPGMPK